MLHIWQALGDVRASVWQKVCLEGKSHGIGAASNCLKVLLLTYITGLQG